MSNHSSEPFDAEEPKRFEEVQKRNKLMRDLLDTTGFKGALGAFLKVS